MGLQSCWRWWCGSRLQGLRMRVASSSLPTSTLTPPCLDLPMAMRCRCVGANFLVITLSHTQIYRRIARGLLQMALTKQHAELPATHKRQQARAKEGEESRHIKKWMINLTDQAGVMRRELWARHTTACWLVTPSTIPHTPCSSQMTSPSRSAAISPFHAPTLQCS